MSPARAPAPGHRPVPRFSVVLQVGDTGPWLQDQIDAIEAIRLDAGDLEVIATDAGSAGGMQAKLHSWAKRSRWAIRVLDRPEAGEASTRSHGLEAAAGEWVLFLGQNDLLLPGALGALGPTLTSSHGVHLVVLPEDRMAGGRPATAVPPPADAAALRVVDLRTEADGLAQAAVLVFRRAALSTAGIALNQRFGGEFAVRDLAARLILALPTSSLGTLRAPGFHRPSRRGDAMVSATGHAAWRFVDVLRYGYLDLLEVGRRNHGQVPAWLQHLVIDELTTWVGRGGTPGDQTPVEASDLLAVRALLRDIATLLDPDVIRTHPFTVADPAWPDALDHGCRAVTWHAREALQTKVDRRSRLMRINYRFVGAQPAEAMSIAGAPVEPAHAKTMAHRYLGMPLVQERILWVPHATTFELRLDGRAAAVVSEVRRAPKARPRLSLVQRGLRRVRRSRKRLGRRALQLVARSWPYAKPFHEAWVLMDRVNNADDNGQRLFEHLRRERPDINAWFVVRRGSDAWRRMRAAGVRRLVAHGSFRWKVLMLNAAWLISSHARKSIVDPRLVKGVLRASTWRYAFLQHGVIKDDLARWLNAADIDLFVVSTPDELQSIVADGTGYQYSSREMRMTGLPRFDRLLAMDRATPAEERRLVLVAPTWRMWLTLPLDRETYRRPVEGGFWSSQYVRAWMELLASEEIAEAVARRNLRLGFMPHPDMQPILPKLDLPPHVERISFKGTDVQSVYAQCALMVTDYSSVAFDLAYIERPVVYFQFDIERVFSGAHIGRAGYFDYERDGFGPVAESAPDAIAAIVAAIEHGPVPAPAYRDRIARTFTQRDGGASARVVEAIETFDVPRGRRES